MKFTIGAALALATGVFASPLPEAAQLEARRTGSQLPSTMILRAVLPNGTVFGSLGSDGNLSTSFPDYPFRVYYTSGNNGNDGNIVGQNYCTWGGQNALQGSQFNCATGNQSMPGQYQESAGYNGSTGYMAPDGPTGAYFSINSLPPQGSSVPVYYGYGGAWGEFQLLAVSASG